MKETVLLIGSPAFLRVWSVLGCEARFIPDSVNADDLKKITDGIDVDVVLYEESAFVSLTHAEQEYFLQSQKPVWIPLPPAGVESER